MSFMHLRRFFLFAAPAALSVALLAAPVRALDQPDDKDAAAAKKGEAAEQAAKLAEAAEQAAKKDEAPPAAQAAKVTPEAKQVIDEVDAAYAKLKSLELAGTFSADMQAAGEDRKFTKKFTATFVAPSKFFHSMEEDMIVVANGQKAYAYYQPGDRYGSGEAPRERTNLARLPEPIPQVLQTQDPSLMFAVVKSVDAELRDTFVDISKADDVQLDGSAYPALRGTLPDGRVLTLLFNPETHLLRQVRYDVRARLEQAGTPDIKQALLTVDYTTVKPDATVKDDLFAWAPPQTARDIAEKQADAAAPGGDDSAAAALEGKAAPDFKLQDMDDKAVALKDLKGKVVVLDMWATWCGPCRLSLPHLDKLYASVKEKGVKVYAVNLQEDKEDVAQFIKNTKLTVPVLLDTDGKVAQAYKAAAIPETVIIGKDGKIAKVFVGFGGEDTAKEMKEAVEKAMK